MVHPVFASIVMEKMIGLISAVNWAIVGGVVLGCWLQPGRAVLWIGLGVLAALAFNGLFLASLHDVVHDFVLRTLARYHQSRLMDVLHRFYGAYADFSRHPRALLANLLLTLLEHGLQLLILYCIVRSLGIELGAPLFFAAASVQMLILRIPVTPDGWGTGELAAIAVFGLIGIGAATAFATSVIYRFLGVIVTLPVFGGHDRAARASGLVGERGAEAATRASRRAGWRCILAAACASRSASSCSSMPSWGSIPSTP